MGHRSNTRELSEHQPSRCVICEPVRGFGADHLRTNKVGAMAYFLKTVSATFAAGLICGAGALVALAPGPASEVPQANKAGASTQPDKAQVAVVSPTSVPCKDQVWPAIDRRCMRWTAEAWSGPNNGAETGKAAEPQTTAPKPAAPPTAQAKAQPPQPETPKAAAPPSAQAKAHPPQPETRQPEARGVEEPRTAAAKPTAPIETSKQPAPQQAATPAQPEPAETRQAETPVATVQPAANDAADESAAVKSAQAEKVKKPRKTR